MSESVNPTSPSVPQPAIALRLAVLVVLGTGAAASTHAAMYQQDPMAGGVRARSEITSISKQGTNVTVNWYGMQGSCTLEAALLGATNFTAVGQTVATDFAWSLTVTNTSTNAFQYRLKQNNAFVGSGGCAGCHGPEYDQWLTTHHSTAYSSIASLPPSVRNGCIVCHTIGQGQPTGFTTITNTPQLANVGCENCHGPAGYHKYSDHSVHPAKTLAAEICGGCHTDAHHPTYNEWTNSPHAVVTEDVAEGSNGILSTNLESGYNRQMTCGPCHSGATRMAMIDNYQDMLVGRTNYLALPSATDSAETAVTCAVCHDPHFRDTNTIHQLRYPVFSTNFYTFFTGSTTTNVYYTNFAGVITTNTYYLNTTFAAQYNPKLAVCAQCHNSRGAQWQGTSRPPHESPQYNLLIGSVQTNYLNGTNITRIATHGRNTSGCARCHVPFITPPGDITDINPVNSGHTFQMVLEGCTGSGCHSSTNSAANQLMGTQLDTTNRITELVGLLNQWATNKGPALFTTNYANYLANGWEFTTTGGLASLTNAGPNSADQGKIPTGIKQARFHLYLVFHDGSLGAHNGNYSRFLLDTARTNVVYQLSLP